MPSASANPRVEGCTIQRSEHRGVCLRTALNIKLLARGHLLPAPQPLNPLPAADDRAAASAAEARAAAPAALALSPQQRRKSGHSTTSA
jgi:hypothetical protein